MTKRHEYTSVSGRGPDRPRDSATPKPDICSEHCPPKVADSLVSVGNHPVEPKEETWLDVCFSFP
jgi:hypothetical protein